MKYEPGSFIVIPNKHILGELTPGALAIYVHLCGFANETGLCYPSRSVLAERIGMHVNSVDRFIVELEEKGLICKGKRHRSDGSISSNEYQLIVVPLTTHSEGGTTTHSEAELNTVLTKSIISEIGISPEYTISPEEPQLSRPRADTRYRAVFDAFKEWGMYSPAWLKNKTQILAAKGLLEERGLQEIKDSLEWYDHYKEDPYCPQVTSPHDLYSKWDRLEAFDKKRV